MIGWLWLTEAFKSAAIGHRFPQRLGRIAPELATLVSERTVR